MKVIKQLNIEPIFKIKQEYLLFDFWTLDKTTKVILKIFKNTFSVYDFKQEAYIKFNANLFNDIIRKAGKNDTLFISFDDSYSSMKITLTNPKIKKSYDLNMLEPSQEDIEPMDKEQKLEFSQKIITNPKNILELLDSLVFTMTKSGEGSVMIIGSKDEIQIKEEEKSLGKSNFSLKDFDEKGFKESIKVKFSLSLLRPLFEFASIISDKTSCELKTNYPIKIMAISPKCELIGFLAPRVDTEDAQ